MSQSSNGEFDMFYESECRNRIPTILWQFFRLGVLIPSEGLNRKFHRSQFSNNWPFIGSNDAEIDFFAHSEIGVSSVPIQNASTHPSVPNVTIYSSPVYDADTMLTKQQVPNLSPEKAPETSVTNQQYISDEKAPDTMKTNHEEQNICHVKADANSAAAAAGIQYILGEISNGGETNILSKITQLERGCAIVLAKSGESNILNVVALGLIVANKDKYIRVFNHINGEKTKLPHVYKLFRAGRIVYVHDRNTTIQFLKKLEMLHEQVNSNVEETNSKVDLLTHQLEQQTQRLEQQAHQLLEQTNQKVDALTNQLDGLTHKMDSLSDLMHQLLINSVSKVSTTDAANNN
jgi:hypothetical protein